jgi:hypothetical protein
MSQVEEAIRIALANELATLRAERDELRAALEAAQRDIEMDNKSGAIGTIRAALRPSDSTPHRGDFRGEK